MKALETDIRICFPYKTDWNALARFVSVYVGYILVGLYSDTSHFCMVTNVYNQRIFFPIIWFIL